MIPPAPQKGRGTAHNPHNRFAPSQSVAVDDGWQQEVPVTQGTEVRIERARTIIARNTSPDLPFDRSINPYRGCEHGCLCSAIGSGAIIVTALLGSGENVAFWGNPTLVPI